MILFALATIGLTNTIVHGKILDVLCVRPLLKEYLPDGVFSGLGCYECVGFWSGLICGAALVSLDPLWILGCGFAGSVISQTYVDLIEFTRSKTDYVISEEDDG